MLRSRADFGRSCACANVLYLTFDDFFGSSEVVLHVALAAEEATHLLARRIAVDVVVLSSPS